MRVVGAIAEPVPPSVIVTGGADGIGRAIALRFRLGGFRVHICDNRASAVEQMAIEHPEIRGTIADVGDRADVARVIAEATAWMGPAGVLVNNVGVSGPHAALEDISATDWDRTFRVNVSGTFQCMQALVPAMKARRAGVIINISTASTRTRLPARAAYVASKYAVEGLTLNAARELGPWGIRCNAILPGIMNNARMDSIIAVRAEQEGRAPAEIEGDYLRCVSLRQRTEPRDVAEMAFFLASEAGARVTGELVSVSGNLEWEE